MIAEENPIVLEAWCPRGPTSTPAHNVAPITVAAAAALRPLSNCSLHHNSSTAVDGNVDGMLIPSPVICMDHAKESGTPHLFNIEFSYTSAPFSYVLHVYLARDELQCIG